MISYFINISLLQFEINPLNDRGFQKSIIFSEIDKDNITHV